MALKSLQYRSICQVLLGLSLGVLTSNIAAPATAQTVDPLRDLDPFEPTPPLPPPTLLPPPEDLLKPPPAPGTETPPAEELPVVPGTITVKRFEVVGSTVFSPEELARVTKPFTNRPLSFAELLQARSAVTQLYTDNGYITSGALIPPQTLQRGTVTIQVVEGGLEAINVTGTRRLRPSYVRARVAKGATKPLNVRRLLETLQLLRLNPLIQNLSADLSTGSQPGTSLLEVQVTEAPSFNPQLILNNARSPSVGSFQRGIQINEGNLLGLGDGASVAYTNTTGSNEVNAGYTLPLNSSDGTLSFNYGTTWSRVVEPPFDFLGIEGASRNYELTLRQPVIQTPTQELALGLTAARRESDISSDLVTDLLPDLPPESQGRTRLTAVRFFQEWTQRSAQSVFTARSQFSVGFGSFAPLPLFVDETEPSSPFFAWRGQAQWGRLLAPDTLLLLRSDVQLTPSSIFPIEQFGLGGQASVRGYRQDAFLTDNGAFASAELRYPVYRLPQQQAVFQLVPFVDLGAAWNRSGLENPSPNNILASVGLGLRFQLGDRLAARLDWGVPLISTEDSGVNTWQENGVYFSVIYSPL